MEAYTGTNKAVLDYQEWLETVNVTNAINEGNVVVQRGSGMPPNYLDEELIQEEIADIDVDVTGLQEDMTAIQEEFTEALETNFSAVSEDSGIVLFEGTEEFEEALGDFTFAEESTVIEEDLLGLENLELSEIASNSLEGIEDVDLIFYGEEAAEIAEAGFAAEGLAAAGTVAVETLGPLALLALATYGITYSLEQIQKEKAAEEEAERQQNFVKRQDDAFKQADAKSTIGEGDDTLSSFYREPDMYAYNPDSKKWYKADEAIKQIDKYISGFNKQIAQLNKAHNLYSKWVINKNNPIAREHPYKPMPPVSLARVMRYKGTTIGLHEKVRQYINDNYSLENSGIMAVDPLTLDHIREQVYGDSQYREALAKAFNTGKYGVRNIDEMETALKPPYWSTFYKLNSKRFMKQDLQEIRNSMKNFKERGGKPLKDIRQHKMTPQERFDRMFAPGGLPGLRHIDHNTGKVNPTREERPIEIKHKDGRRPISQHKPKIPPTPVKHDVPKTVDNIHLHPSKEWALEPKSEEYDPNLGIHYNNLANLAFQYKTKYPSFDDFPKNALMKKYTVKQELGDRDGYMLYDPADNNIVLTFEGTDYPNVSHGFYKKFLKDLFSGLQSNLQEYKGDHFHSGFLEKYLRLQPAVSAFVKKHLQNNSNIILTGFSSGGALAQIFGYQLAKDLRKKNIAVYSYASPRVFSTDTAKNVNKILPNNYRVNLNGDLIPFFPLKNTGSGGYRHAGTEFLYDKNGKLRRYVGDIDVDRSYTLKDILKVMYQGWKEHTRDNYRAVLDKHLASFHGLGKGIKSEIEMLQGLDKLFSETDSFSKVNDRVYRSGDDILYYPSYHRGEISMTPIPKRYIQGLYFYRPGEFKNTTGNVKGFVVY